MTIEELRAKNLILLECITGSKAYGLDLPHSDTDIRGIFILPKKQYYGLLKNHRPPRCCLSSIPRDEQPLAYLSFNQDGYIK